jgi:hypothetical protein
LVGLSELEQLLQRRFEVLVSQLPGLAERHATLRGAIDWSWRLLSAPASAALARCSVFRGGFSFEAFEAVAAPPEGDGTVGALDLLQALHDKSFLAAAPESMAGERRFVLYESIRAYALERLCAEGALEATARRHAEYYLKHAEGWCRELDGPRGSELRRRLVLERDNLLAIHERGVASRDRSGVDWAVRVRGLEVVFAMRGRSALRRLSTPRWPARRPALPDDRRAGLSRARADPRRAGAFCRSGARFSARARARRARGRSSSDQRVRAQSRPGRSHRGACRWEG